VWRCVHLRLCHITYVPSPSGPPTAECQACSWNVGTTGGCQPGRCNHKGRPHNLQLRAAVFFFGSVLVTREHVRHNKSGIAHRGRTGINHFRELPTKLNHFCSGGQGNLPNRTREPQVCLWSAGCREVGGGGQPVIPKSRAAFINLEKQVIPRAALGAQNSGLSYETVCWLVQPGQSAP
jgi:hypothetical protein